MNPVSGRHKCTTSAPMSAGTPPAAEGNAGEELAVKLGVFEQRPVRFGGERTRADAIDGDAVGREFERQGFGEPEQSGLARGVSGASGKTRVAHDGGQINDAPIPATLHERDHGAAHQEGAGQVGVENPVPFLQREVGDVLADVDSPRC